MQQRCVTGNHVGVLPPLTIELNINMCEREEDIVFSASSWR